jgi:hypothetical protein
MPPAHTWYAACKLGTLGSCWCRTREEFPLICRWLHHVLHLHIHGQGSDVVVLVVAEEPDAMDPTPRFPTCPTSASQGCRWGPEHVRSRRA